MKFHIITAKRDIHEEIECGLRRCFHYDATRTISSNFWFGELYDKFMTNTGMVEFLIEAKFEKNIKYVRRERG